MKTRDASVEDAESIASIYNHFVLTTSISFEEAEVPAIEMAVSRFTELRQLESEVEDLTERLETRKLVDRAKGVELRSKHDGWSRAVLQNRDDAGSAYTCRDFVAELAELRRELGGGFGFLGRELGVRVKVPVEKLRLRVGALNFRLNAGLLLLRGKGRG